MSRLCPQQKKHPLEGEWVQEKRTEVPPAWAGKAAEGAGVGWFNRMNDSRGVALFSVRR
jgi:hypothetical protein